jgi:hypothetical protein
MPTTVKPKPVPAGDIVVVDNGPASGQHPAAEHPTADDDHDDDNNAEPGRLDDAAGRDPSDDLLCRRIT